jgi:hypothetical protein
MTVDGLSNEELAASFGQVDDQLNRLIDLNMQLAISRNWPERARARVRSAGFPQPMFSATCQESQRSLRRSPRRLITDGREGGLGRVVATCDEVVVAIGVGGNVSVPCAAADVILFAAEETFNSIELCNNDIVTAALMRPRPHWHIHDSRTTTPTSRQSSPRSRRSSSPQVSTEYQAARGGAHLRRRAHGRHLYRSFARDLRRRSKRSPTPWRSAIR